MRRRIQLHGECSACVEAPATHVDPVAQCGCIVLHGSSGVDFCQKTWSDSAERVAANQEARVWLMNRYCKSALTRSWLQWRAGAVPDWYIKGPTQLDATSAMSRVCAFAATRASWTPENVQPFRAESKKKEALVTSLGQRLAHAHASYLGRAIPVASPC
jgi:hypothetical protein